MTILSILLDILLVFLIYILKSVNAKKTINPLIKISMELKQDGMNDTEIKQFEEEYKKTLNYAMYELQLAYYELGQSFKQSK